jgi:hypothetical protein
LVDIQGGYRFLVDCFQGVHAEIVANGHVKIRVIGSRALQGTRIQIRVKLLSHPFGVRVALDIKHESGARGALRHKALFRSGGAAVAEAVVITCIGL